ncbi:hypothetical protein FD05_GL002184 [Lentilactobacillus otakiensis DSM 19908 = JCM 15040]|nr:hypothetical protein FD05_GL002184 [Lentilactobacillus otakiensis DSM 19908 = JCM 15040]
MPLTQITAWADNQVITKDYINQDYQAILSGIQNSSDAIKSSQDIATSYTFLTHSLNNNDKSLDAHVEYEEMANLLQSMGRGQIYDNTPYTGLRDPSDDTNYDKIAADKLAAATKEAEQDRNGAQFIYDRLFDRLTSANKSAVQINWDHVQKDTDPNDIEEDLTAFYSTLGDGLTTWSNGVTVKSLAPSTSVYTIPNSKKKSHEYVALYIPKNKIKDVISRAYKLFKKGRYEVIKNNRSAYVFETLFATYNLASGRLQNDRIDGVSSAWNYDNNFVKSTGGKTTYKQGISFLKRAYRYRGSQNIVISGYYFNHNRATLRLNKWDGYLTPDALKLKRNVFYYRN